MLSTHSARADSQESSSSSTRSNKSKRRHKARSTPRESASTVPRSNSFSYDALSATPFRYPNSIARSSTVREGKQWQGQTVPKLSTILESAASRMRNGDASSSRAPRHDRGESATGGGWWTWLLGNKSTTISQAKLLSAPTLNYTSQVSQGATTEPVPDVTHGPHLVVAVQDPLDVPADEGGIDETVGSFDSGTEDVGVSPTAVLWFPSPDVGSPHTLGINSSSSSLPSRITSAPDPSRTTLATTPGQSSVHVCSTITEAAMLEAVDDDGVPGEVVQLKRSSVVVASGVGLGIDLDPETDEWTDEEEEDPEPIVRLPLAALPKMTQPFPNPNAKRLPDRSSRGRYYDREESLMWLVKHNRWRGDGSLRHELCFRYFEESCPSIDSVLLHAAMVEMRWYAPDGGADDSDGEAGQQGMTTTDSVGWKEAILAEAQRRSATSETD